TTVNQEDTVKHLESDIQIYAEALNDAIKKLFVNDSSLLENDVAERAICAQIGQYLKPHFPNHNVDVEYDRHGIEPKRVRLPKNCRSTHKSLILPDIVVHQRAHDRENLMVIQVKKETNSEPRACDRAIVLAMKRDFKYAVGVLLDLPAGSGAAARTAKFEWLSKPPATRK
ncbi:MAG: hypothetical protein WCD04_20220, partial [Terriglobia bacterium]